MAKRPIDDDTPEVVLYTTHCPKCIVLEKKMEAKKIKYKTVDDIEKIQDRGYMSVPMMEVDNEVMDFKEANDWINKQ